MSRGLFDLIHDYQNQSNPTGYAPFDPSYGIDPYQAIAMQARGNLMSNPGAGHALAGNVIGSGIGSLVKKGIQSYREHHQSKEQIASRGIGASIDDALQSGIAKALKADPTLTTREATVKAANDLYRGTANSKLPKAIQDAIRKTAMGALSSAGEFDPEATAKYAAAKKDLASAGDLGSMKVLENSKSKARVTVPEKMVPRFLEDHEGFGMIDTPASDIPDTGKTATAFEGNQRLTYMYDPDGSLSGKKPGPDGWVAFSGDARAAAGGNEAADNRTKSDISDTAGDFYNSLAGLEQINMAIDGVGGLIDQAEKEGVKGTTGVAGKFYRVMGETTTLVSMAAQAAKEFAKGSPDGKVYDEGRQDYSELTNVKKYEDVFKSFSGGQALSARVRASMINLAYLMAITQESSARAISDNDVKLRLQTLGSDISAGKSVRQILEDRRMDAVNGMEARLRNDPKFSNDEFVNSRFSAIKQKYVTDRQKPGPPGNPNAGRKRPGTVRLGPKGVVIE